MKCHEPHKNLFSYAERALGAEERAEVERHLEFCASCRDFLAHLSQVTVIIDEEVRSIRGNAFTERVKQRLHTSVKTRKLPLSRRLLPDLVAASVMAAAILAGVSIGRVWSSGTISDSAIREKVQFLNDMSHEPVESFILTLYSGSHE